MQSPSAIRHSGSDTKLRSTLRDSYRGHPVRHSLFRVLEFLIEGESLREPPPSNTHKCVLEGGGFCFGLGFFKPRRYEEKLSFRVSDKPAVVPGTRSASRWPRFQRRRCPRVCRRGRWLARCS